MMKAFADAPARRCQAGRPLPRWTGWCRLLRTIAGGPVSPFPLDAFLAGLPWTALAVVVVLAVTFAVAVRQGRHSVMDVAWGPGFVVVAAVSWLLSAGTGDDTRRLLLLGPDVRLGAPARRPHRLAGPRRARGPALHGDAQRSRVPERSMPSAGSTCPRAW